VSPFRKKSRLSRLALGLALVGVTGTLAASSYVERRFRTRTLPLAQAPAAPVALVFGAGLIAGGEPSPVLAERLDTALRLYRAKRVSRLLVSGDNSERYHNETLAMQRYLVERGVPPADVDADFAGFSTYDSCYRARTLFGVTQALLVTQDFHLPRALYIANQLGIEAWGVAADEGKPDRRGDQLRELWARPLALVMVLLRPEPRRLGPSVAIE
jgi:SanA protein